MGLESVAKKTPAVVERSLLTWLRGPNQLLVSLDIGRVAEAMPRGAPVARVVLVMRVEGAHIKNKGLARLAVHGGVAVPAVAVHQTRLQSPYSSL